MGRAPHDDEDGISDEEKSESDPEEAYTAVRSVVSIPKQAAEEGQENPKVAELKERLINAYRGYSAASPTRTLQIVGGLVQRRSSSSQTRRSIVIGSTNFRAIGPRP